MKKKISEIIVFIGLIVCLIGGVVDGLSVERFVSVLTGYTPLTIIIACCFVFAKNATVKNVGYGICALEGGIGLTSLLYYQPFIGTVESIGMVFLLVGAVVYFIAICVKFFGFSKVNNKEILSLEKTLEGYKEMENASVISKEEFDKLKESAISSIGVSEITFEDLKKWKKLLDQKVITEEEFAELKSKVFKNN